MNLIRYRIDVFGSHIAEFGAYPVHSSARYMIRARHLFFFFSFFFYLVPRYVYVGTYVPGLHLPPKKNRRPIDEIAPKKQNIKQQPKYRAHGDGRLQRRRG